MKQLLIIIGVVLFISSCGKQNATPTNPLNEMVDTTGSMLLLSGMFTNGPHGMVSGRVNIYTNNEQSSLALNDFETSNGPDLHVYLSREVQPVHFIDLGKLKSTNGNQVYPVPDSTNFNLYKYALIHCQEYNHLFGSSELR